MSSSILSVRAADAEPALVKEAEMSRRIIEVPADQWHQIESMLTAPAKVIPAVQEISKYQPK